MPEKLARASNVQRLHYRPQLHFLPQVPDRGSVKVSRRYTMSFRSKAGPLIVLLKAKAVVIIVWNEQPNIYANLHFSKTMRHHIYPLDRLGVFEDIKE
ncbi:hypothetical protein BX616_005828 [Lobosporangium transversale]|nr:hypothetical protein BX616_005828 [Lobosporangium transversale]